MYFRVFRKEHIERNPIIIDIQDNFSVYKNQSAGRKVFYKKHFKNEIFEEENINDSNYCLIPETIPESWPVTKVNGITGVLFIW